MSPKTLEVEPSARAARHIPPMLSKHADSRPLLPKNFPVEITHIFTHTYA
jgi:hypothetical protein